MTAHDILDDLEDRLGNIHGILASVLIEVDNDEPIDRAEVLKLVKLAQNLCELEEDDDD